MVSEVEREFEALMARLRSGAPEAVREMLELYGPHILHVVRRHLHRKLRSKFDSRDFAQDVWASFYAIPPERYTFKEPRDLLRYLIDVARNKVIDAYRHHAGRGAPNLDREQLLDSALGPGWEEVPARQPTPSQFAVANERWHQLLEGQPDHYQRVLILLKQGITHQQIARELGISDREVRRIVRRLAGRNTP
jgi:RNA polymerase sigma-70 factor (ECF subfamily)